MTLEQLGWNAHWQATFESIVGAGKSDSAAPLLPGRIARQHGVACVVYCAGRALRAAVRGAFRDRARGPGDFPAVGDWVALERPPQATQGRIHHLLPRRSAIRRKVAGDASTDQVIAANADVLLICCGLDGDYNLRRIERYLTLAHGCGVRPWVLLTKADLRDDLDAPLVETLAVAGATPVTPVSVVDGRGLPQLRGALPPGETAVLAGSSGAGKSTLINALLGREAMATGAVRAYDSRGRHTTTHRELLTTPGGGVIIDTPGMRELQFRSDAADASETFADIERLAGSCRFSDCRHAAEPGCAVRAAVAAGEVAPGRLASYEKQQRELAWLVTREDPAALAERRDKWKAIHKAARKHYRRKYRIDP